MAYYLGIDLGTTFTAAAIWRDGRVEVCSLGNRAPAIPSVVLLREDEEVLTGEAAVRRASTEPHRVAREFKRRVGDPTPIIVGGAPYSADALTARLLRSVVDKVSESEGGPPDGIAICHPANWGDFKKDLLRQAIDLADLPDQVTTITEPEAAAIHYASQERVEPGAVIAVYDLGGGTFDAAVLRKAGTGWEILGEPQGVERLGGVDFDEAVFQHVAASVGEAIQDLDPEDPTALAAVARLRQECVDAKEALSSDTDVSIPVLLPNLQTEVRMTRAEFEQMVRPPLGDSITALHRALRLAGVEPSDVTAVLLVGGSSRIPLVAEMVGSELGRPVAVDAHPKYGIALGAAMIAAEHGSGGAVVTEEVGRIAEPLPAPVPVPAPPAEPREAVPASPVGQVSRDDEGLDDGRGRHLQDPGPAPGSGDGGDGGDGRKPPLGFIAGGVAALLVVIVAVLLLNGGGDDGGGEQTVGAGDTGEETGTDGDEGDTGETTPTEAPTTETPTTAGPEFETPFVEITGVAPAGDYYEVSYTTHGFVPSQDGMHIHLALDTMGLPENLGGNGEPPGDWYLTYEPTTDVTDFGPQAGATQMCAVIADPSHNVYDRERELDPARRSGNCYALD